MANWWEAAQQCLANGGKLPGQGSNGQQIASLSTPVGPASPHHLQPQNFAQIQQPHKWCQEQDIDIEYRHCSYH